MNKMISVLLLAKVASFAAAAPASAAPPMSPMRLDVAGVRLGMPLNEAQAAARKAGYKCEEGSKEPTFDELVEREIAKRRGKSTLFLPANAPRISRCMGPNGEALSIEYAQLQTGTIVDEYHLRIQGNTIDIPAGRNQLAAKYGKPTMGDLMNGAWCDPGYRCGAAPALTDGPLLMIETRVDVSIVGTRGGSAHRADEAAVVSAADKIAPKNSKAAF